MPKRIARSSPSVVYRWYRSVCKYTPFASMIATLMWFEGFKSARIVSVKEWHYARTGVQS